MLDSSRLPAPRHQRRLLVGVGALFVVAFIAVVLVIRIQEPAEPRSRGQPEPGSQVSAVLRPTASELRIASVYAAKRVGRVSFAVIDTSGSLACHGCRMTFKSASVVKAMLLVAYLESLVESGQPLTAHHEAHLDSMIRLSDNASATAIYAHVGDEGLYSLAREARMDDFGVSGSWGSARTTAADQARFFAVMDELAPDDYRSFIRDLLSSIVPEQLWGIPEVSRPTWDTFFKGGWLTTTQGNVVHQVARLERDGMALVIAVFTDGAPNDAYGRGTIRGIASRLLSLR